MIKWKKPPKPINSFADAIKLTGIKAYNTTHYVRFDGLITGNKFSMKLAEFDKIIAAGRFEDNIIKGEFFLNNQGLIRLYK
jgi:hypothetical protein